MKRLGFLGGIRNLGGRIPALAQRSQEHRVRRLRFLGAGFDRSFLIKKTGSGRGGGGASRKNLDATPKVQLRRQRAIHRRRTWLGTPGHSTSRRFSGRPRAQLR